MSKNNAFTLAEIMIVLTVIGILTAILLPIAFQAAPDENVMKFKKANATLATVIRELVNSDKYYLNGDLGTRADGTLIDGTHDGDVTYFCETFADVISTKKVECSDTHTAAIYYTTSDTYSVEHDENLEKLDSVCVNYADAGEEIVASDGVVYYQTCPDYTFGHVSAAGGETPASKRVFSDPSLPANKPDSNGFDAIYKFFCIDVDGINQGEAPFGYGIRADGKILYGARANLWIQKSIQQNDD